MKQEYAFGEHSSLWTIPLVGTRQTAGLPFALRYVGRYHCDASYYTSREGLEECLIMYTLSGSGLIQYEGTEHILLPGQAFLIDCRQKQYYATHGNHWHFLWFHFYGNCAFSYAEMLNAEGAVPLSLDGHISFRDYYDKLTACARNFDTQSELQISLIIHELLTDLITLKKTKHFSSRHGNSQPLLEDSILFLQKHYNESITIEQAAEICHLSKYHFIKLFKAYTGQTPYDYLMSYRLQQAQKLLLETSRSVSTIAQETGFSEAKNFIACFKKKVGQTPLQYRKQNRL